MAEDHSNPAASLSASAPPKSDDVSREMAGCIPVGNRCLTWLLAGLLVFVTVILYWPTTHHDFLHYDDGLYVTENAHVQNGPSLANLQWAFSHSVTGNWHPLTMVSHMLDCQFYGLHPWGHHFTNLLLHGLNTALVFLLLLRLTGAVWRSVLVAALFGVHPVNVESVAWVAERKSVLSAFWGLLTLLFYASYAQASGASSQKSEAGVRAFNSSFFILHSSSSFWLAWLCLALGLMSKSLLVTWPFVLLLLDFWPLKRFQPDCLRQLLWEKLPFFALVAAVSLATVMTHQEEGDLMTFPLGARVENALISFWRYLAHLFWPVNLAVFYPHPGYWPTPEVMSSGILLAGLTGLFWFQRRRYPFLLMGWLWFAGTLVPVVGLVQVGAQAMADRHAYLPSLGVFIMISWGAFELTRRWRVTLVAWSAASLATLILCFALTRHQLAYWQNDETLFRRALAVTSNNFVAHNNLGIVLGSQGRLDAAIGEFQAAIRIQPDYADAHFNLGKALLEQGQTTAAIQEYQAAFQLETYDSSVYYNLGNLLAKQGRTDAAIPLFQETIHLQPDDADAHNNLGNLLAQQGQTGAAIRELQEATRLRPDFPDAHYNLGNTLLKTGRLDEALTQFQEAIRLQPNYAPTHYNLGVVLSKQGQTDAAISQFQEALLLQPDYAIAHNSMGIALAARGRLDEAIIQFQAALRIKPGFASAHDNLAKALALKNQSIAQPPEPAKP